MVFKKVRLIGAGLVMLLERDKFDFGRQFSFAAATDYLIL